MFVFQWTLVLLAGAVALTAIARRIGVPYPSLLALGGTALALLNISPDLRLIALTLALFVAPVLLDAAYDTSLRDLRAQLDAGRPVLVVIAVVITTGAVAWSCTRWCRASAGPAAIALGAIAAPPDAAAATGHSPAAAPPHRVVVILEGESLLNDASALLIYRLAVASVMPHGPTAGDSRRRFVLAIVGSVVRRLVWRGCSSRVTRARRGRAEPDCAAVRRDVRRLAARRAPWGCHRSSRSWCSASRRHGYAAPARRRRGLRVPSFAVWETGVVVLNVLAFILIGLQVRPILAALDPAQRLAYLRVALAVLFVVVAVRAGWIATYIQAALWKAKRFGGGRWPGPNPPTWKGVAIVIWCGMRGIVTLAAAYALPMASAGSPGVPYRDLIVLCAFGVVVGTLVLQGLTLRPLISALHIKADRSVDQEVHHASERLAHVALEALSGRPLVRSTRAEAGADGPDQPVGARRARAPAVDPRRSARQDCDRAEAGARRPARRGRDR